MKQIFVPLLLAFLLANTAKADVIAQDLLLYWSFDKKSAAPSFFSSSINPRGYSGNSLELSGKPFPVELSNPIRIRKRFSVNFWIKPSDIESTQSILELAGNKHQKIEFGLQNQTIYCIVNGHTIEHYPFMILSNDWSLVSLSFDGKSFHLTLFSSEVTSTSHFAVSNFSSPIIKAVNLSKGKNKNYRGLIDEIMIYGKETRTTELEKMYEGQLPQTSASPTPPQEPVAVNTTPPKKQIVKEKKATPVTPEKKESPEPKQPDRYFAGEVVVVQRSLILEIKNWKKLKQKYDINLNGKKIVSGKTDPTGITLIELDTDESNALTFVPTDPAKPAEELNIKLWDGTKVIKNLDLLPHAKHETLYNITHRFINKTITEVQRTVKVSQRQLHIEVWDDKLSDGDFVSILYNDEKLIDYQEVSKEKIHIDLTVDNEGSNLISFISEDSGKYGNNSAKVRILENGKLIDEFRFTSSYRKKAGLLIQVQGKDNKDKER